MPVYNQHQLTTALSDRKKNLIAQGASFRAGVVMSRMDVQKNLHPQQMAKNAINQLSGNSLDAIQSIYNSGALSSDNLKILLPVLTAGISFIANEALIRRFLGKAVVAGLLAATVFVAYKKISLWRKRNKAQG